MRWRGPEGRAFQVEKVCVFLDAGNSLRPEGWLVQA